MRRSRQGKRLVVLVLVASTLPIAARACAADRSRQGREKAEVRAIFAMLLSRTEPGDGWPDDPPCVFAEE
jgi:hypothetical protein